MDEINQKRFKQIASNLQRVVECPVCLAPLRPPVSLCDRGHGVCPDCKPRLRQCPLCRASYSNAAIPLAFHQLLEALPRRCRYEPRGCMVMFCTGEDHELFCSFRSTKCRVKGCSWFAAVRDLHTHIRKSHVPPNEILDGEQHYFSYPNFDPSQDSTAYTPIIVYKHFLWQVTRMDVEKRKLLITFYHLPLEPPREELFVLLSMEKEGFHFQYTIRVSVKDEGDEDIGSLDSVMVVPQSMLPKLIRTQAGLLSALKVIRVHNS